jgi:hypothetical protein
MANKKAGDYQTAEKHDDDARGHDSQDPPDCIRSALGCGVGLHGGLGRLGSHQSPPSKSN